MNIIKDHPFIATVKNLFDQSECEEIISTSESFTRSKTLDPGTALGMIDRARTSSTSFADRDWEIKIKKKIFDQIKDRHQNIKLSINHFERLQMQLYESHQEYQRHYDFFMLDDPKFNGNNRIATAIIYLNDEMVGGETYFPKLDIMIKPETGKMLYFEYNYGKEINDLTEHAGSPVTEGEKYIITAWVRINPLTST